MYMFFLEIESVKLTAVHCACWDIIALTIHSSNSNGFVHFISLSYWPIILGATFA